MVGTCVRSSSILAVWTLCVALAAAGCGGGGGDSAPEERVLFSDDFERAPGPCSYPWEQLGGISIADPANCDILAEDASNSVLRMRRNVTPGTGNVAWTDYTYSARVAVSNLDTAVSLRFRVRDQSFYYAGLESGNQLRIGKFVGGSWATLPGTTTAAVSYEAGVFYQLKVVVQGPRIRVYFDGGASPVLDWTDTAADPFLDGRIALFCFPAGGGSALVDGVRVTATTPVVYDLHWDGANYGAAGNGTPYEISSHFTPGDVEDMVGGRIVKVRVYVYDVPAGSMALRIYQGGTSQPGSTVACDQSIDLGSLTANAWNEITLAHPVTITGSHYWVGFAVDPGVGSSVHFGLDIGPGNPKGVWMFTGGNWIDSDLDENWNIRTIVSVP